MVERRAGCRAVPQRGADPRVMGAIAGLIIFVLHPQAAGLQAQAFSATDETVKKAAFEAFFRIHMPVRSLYIVNLVLGILLVGIKVKQWLR